MSMFSDDMMPHEHLVEYLKKAGITRRSQIKVLRAIWKKEKDGWNPPHILKKRLDYLIRPRGGGDVGVPEACRSRPCPRKNRGAAGNPEAKDPKTRAG
jgi:hypothetical protein